MEAAWNVETWEKEKKPWQGSHAKRCVSLWLLFANGSKRACHYGNLEDVDVIDGMMKIYFSNKTVLVIGRHLDELASLVAAECAVYLREQHASPFEVQRHEPYIERIDFQPPNPEAQARKPGATG
jgi:hypothetical protein